MAVGDLVTADGMYEFNGMLFSDGLSSPWVVTKTTGFRSMPELLHEDEPRQDDDGSIEGVDRLPGRHLMLELEARRSAVAASAYTEPLVRRAFYKTNLLIPFVFQIDVYGKCYVLARPRRRHLPVIEGSYHGYVALFCPDPRIYTFVESVPTITIGTGSTSQGGVVTQTGDYPSPPTLEISGPATNPRILNNTAARTIAIDVVIPVGQSLVIDTKARTIKLNGVDTYASKRTDNQWWKLLAGANTLTYSRAAGNTGSASVLTVRHRGAFL